MLLDINPRQKEMHLTPSGIDCSLLNAEPEKPSPAPTLRKNLVPFFIESCDLAASCLFKFQSLSMHELPACVALRKQIMQMKNEARTNQIRKAKSFRLYNQTIYYVNPIYLSYPGELGAGSFLKIPNPESKEPEFAYSVRAET